MKKIAPKVNVNKDNKPDNGNGKTDIKITKKIPKVPVKVVKVPKKPTDLQERDFDQEDLDMGDDLNLSDFDDPDYFSNDSSDIDVDPFLPILAEFFEYDGQNVAEILCQIRDSIDSNSKCMLRIAYEMKVFNANYYKSLAKKADFVAEEPTINEDVQVKDVADEDVEDETKEEDADDSKE